MAVPNTDTFSLQDVVDEINPTTGSLDDCFVDAIASSFNSTYSGSKNSLLNFRNYGNTETLTAFQMTTQKYYNEANIDCGDSTYTTYYHNGSESYPQIGDIIYEDSSGTTLHDGRFFGSDAWRIFPPYREIISINGSGTVTGTSDVCQVTLGLD